MMKSSATFFLRSSFAVLVLLFGALGHAHASTVSVPEIDASVAASGIALLSGVMLMVRGRRR